VRTALDDDLPAESFPEAIAALTASLGLPGYTADLVRLEWLCHRTKTDTTDAAVPVAELTVNPSVTLLPLTWKNLASFFDAQADRDQPYEAPTHVMTWRHPHSGRLFCREALENDLLALKIAVEQIQPREAARQGQVTPGEIQAVVDQAVAQGILLAPDSRVRRSVRAQTAKQPELKPFLAADIFTLQWHVTQDCDLHCKHCYDRSRRVSLPLDKAQAVLDDFYASAGRCTSAGRSRFPAATPCYIPTWINCTAPPISWVSELLYWGTRRQWSSCAGWSRLSCRSFSRSAWKDWRPTTILYAVPAILSAPWPFWMTCVNWVSIPW